MFTIKFCIFLSLVSLAVTASFYLVTPGYHIANLDPYLSTKEEFLQEVRLWRSSEQVNELTTNGGFYTEQEMKDVLKWGQFLYI